MSEITAAEARTIRLLAGKPLAEVQRWWNLESSGGLNSQAMVPVERATAPTNYAQLAELEEAANVSTFRMYECDACHRRSFVSAVIHTSRSCPETNCNGTQDPEANAPE